MRHLFLVLGLLVAVSTFTAPAPVRAQSNEECSIWLCAPFGFALPNCGVAFKAMIKRVVRFKPAFPSWGSCQTEDSGVEMSFNEGIAAVMVMEQKNCISPGPTSSDDECNEWEVQVPGEYIRDERCLDVGYGQRPDGCLATYRYIEVFRDGEPYGDIYYWPE